MDEHSVARPEVRPVEEAVEVLREAGKRAPRLFGIPTGVEGLDGLFYTTRFENGVPQKVPLGGYPALGVINLTGVADTGKTLMAEQFAVKQASLGYPVCFITVEAPGLFTAGALRTRATAMGIDFAQIQDRIVLVDAASHAQLRDDLPTLLATLAHTIRRFDTKSVVIDSVTGLFEAKEIFARQVVRQLFNFMKRWYQTAIFVSQKRTGHEEFTAEAAGGYAVSHIVDCTIVLAKRLIQTPAEARLYHRPIGEVVRMLRIDGCRLCGHSTATHLLEITETGLVKVGPPISRLGGREETYAGG